MKFRNCSDCGKYKYIEGNGLCRSCYNKNDSNYSFSYESPLDRLDNTNNGHQLVIGKKRSGRTVTNKIELYDAIKNSNSHVYMIDNNGEYEDLINEVGGEYFSMSAYDCLNLLHVEKSSSSQMSLATRIKRVIDLIRRCYCLTGLVMDKVREKVLVTVIKEAYSNNGIELQPSTHTNPSPTISDVIDMLDDLRSNPKKFPKYKSYNDKRKIKATLKHLHLELRDIDNRLGIRDNIGRDFSKKNVVCFDISPIKSMNIRGVRVQMLLNEIFEYAKTNSEKNLLYVDDCETLFSAPSSTLQSIPTIFRHGSSEDLGVCLSTRDSHGIITSDTFQSLCNIVQYRRIHRMTSTTDDIQKILQLSDKQYAESSKLQVGGGKNDESKVLFSGSKGDKHSKESIKIDDRMFSKI